MLHSDLSAARGCSNPQMNPRKLPRPSPPADQCGVSASAGMAGLDVLLVLWPPPASSVVIKWLLLAPLTSAPPPLCSAPSKSSPFTLSGVFDA